MGTRRKPDANGDGKVDFNDFNFSSIQDFLNRLTSALGLGTPITATYDPLSGALTFPFSFDQIFGIGTGASVLTPGVDLVTSAPLGGGGKFTLAAVSGGYTVAYNGHTSGTLAYDAGLGDNVTAGTFANALHVLGNLPTGYVVKCANSTTAHPTTSCAGGPFRVFFPDGSSAIVSPNQVVQAVVGATSGTFGITNGTQTQGPIAYNVSLSDFVTALNGVGLGSASSALPARTATPPSWTNCGGVFQIVYDGASVHGAAQKGLSFDSTNLKDDGNNLQVLSVPSGTGAFWAAYKNSGSLRSAARSRPAGTPPSVESALNSLGGLSSHITGGTVVEVDGDSTAFIVPLHGFLSSAPADPIGSPGGFSLDFGASLGDLASVQTTGDIIPLAELIAQATFGINLNPSSSLTVGADAVPVRPADRRHDGAPGRPLDQRHAHPAGQRVDDRARADRDRQRRRRDVLDRRPPLHLGRPGLDHRGGSRCRGHGHAERQERSRQRLHDRVGREPHADQLARRGRRHGAHEPGTSSRRSTSRTPMAAPSAWRSVGTRSTPPNEFAVGTSVAAASTPFDTLFGSGNYSVDGSSTVGHYVINFTGTNAGKDVSPIGVSDTSKLLGAMTDGNVSNANFTVTLTNQPAVETKISTDAAINVSTVHDGTSTQNEVQQIVVKATTGTYTLSFLGQTTAALAFNANATAVQAALAGLSTIGAGNVAVAPQSLGVAFLVTFQGTLAKQNVANLGAASTVATQEVQNIDLLDATGGTFTVTLNGHTSGKIAWDADATTGTTAKPSVTAQLATVLTGSTYVVANGSGAGHWTITFAAGAPHVDVLVGDGGGLENANALATLNITGFNATGGGCAATTPNSCPQVVAAQLQLALDAQAVAQGLEPIDHVDATTHAIAVHVTSSDISGGVAYGSGAAPSDQAFELDITPTNTLTGVGHSGSFTIDETSGTFTLTLANGTLNATTSALTVGASAGTVQAAIGVLLAALGINATVTVTKTGNVYSVVFAGGPHRRSAT